MSRPKSPLNSYWCQYGQNEFSRAPLLVDSNNCNWSTQKQPQLMLNEHTDVEVWAFHQYSHVSRGMISIC